jgi:enoyl-CoA hydratase/carnithine racemase
MWMAIAEHCHALARDSTVRLLVVRGQGEHFCAGADITGLAAADPREYQRANVAADQALASFPKPTIAVITGACVGGGTELAVACDLRIADTTARFGITPARLGLIYPAQAVARVVRLIGPSPAKHLLYSAELIDAQRALRVGLIDEMHPPEQLGDRVTQLADRLARRRSLLTLMASKEMVDAVAEHGTIPPEVVTRWTRTLAESSDPAEGIASFLERRDPSFAWTPDEPGDVAPSGREPT